MTFSHTLEQNYDQVTRSLANVGGEVQQTRRDVETASRTLLNCVTAIGQQVIEKVTFLAQETLDIKQSVSRIASMVLSLSLEFSSFRLLLMSFQRNPVDEYYFTIEDALGRVFPIHLNTITSWEAFGFVLSEKFKGAAGARRVRDKRYRLTEHATRREIDQSNNWERTFRPHQKIVMSLLCKDANQTSATDSQLATCPWCKTESDSDTSTQVQCRGCNMFFTRVVELDDLALPPHPSGNSREAPEFGRPSFNVQLPPGWTNKKRGKRPRDGGDTWNSNKRPKSNTKKRSYNDKDDDVESDDEDIDGLVRVTVVSRRKRIKIFQVSSSNRNGFQTSLGGFASSLQASVLKHSGTEGPPLDRVHKAIAPAIGLKIQHAEPPLPFMAPPSGYTYNRYENIRQRASVVDVDDDRVDDGSVGDDNVDNDENDWMKASSDWPPSIFTYYRENYQAGDHHPSIFLAANGDAEWWVAYWGRSGESPQGFHSQRATFEDDRCKPYSPRAKGADSKLTERRQNRGDDTHQHLPIHREGTRCKRRNARHY